MKFFVLLAAYMVLAEAFTLYELARHEWNEFKLQHHKTYDSKAEEQLRMKIYLQNKHMIAKHNLRYELGLETFRLGINQYSDLQHDEFVKTMTGFIPMNPKELFKGSLSKGAITFIKPGYGKLPSTVDWRQSRAVTAVKNQARCGSCWAFSATGALEGQHFLKTGELVSLSEQNLIDCSTANHGCAGGNQIRAYQYIIANGGIDTEESYQYEAINGTCRFDSTTIGATVRGFTIINQFDEEALQAAVATVGPVAVSIDASCITFQHYQGNMVYYEPQCNATHLTHGVLIVGYGTTQAGEDYWLVKNSWGTTWGNDGYIMMARNRDNNCGIASGASYPVV